MNGSQLEQDLLYLDSDVLVLNKPADRSLLADRSGAESYWEQLKSAYGKLYVVHRLDKGTSGVLVVATSQQRQSSLTKMFAERRVSKHYVALLAGTFPTGSTQVIDLPLCKGRKSRYRVAGQRETIRSHENKWQVEQDRDGVSAQTRARAVATNTNKSWVALKPSTGRAHQLRVHTSWCGYPICGDPLYGGAVNKTSADRLMLHCHKLVIPDLPTFVAPLPEQWLRG